MTTELFGNVAETTLASGITSSATSLTVASSADFPAASTALTAQFRAAFVDASGDPLEYITVTNVSGTTWTVVRQSEDSGRFPQAARLTNDKIVHVVSSNVIQGRLGAPLWTPSDNGLLAASYHPGLVSSGSIPTSGMLVGSRLHLPRPETITNLVLYVSTAGVTLTANQCIAALYTADGTLIDVTGNQATAWTSVGTKIMPIGTPYAAPAGDYCVCWWAVGTTIPQFSRCASTALSNVGLAAPDFLFFSANTGLTTTAPATLGTRSAVSPAYWAGMS